ncbi:putative polypeptide N-acetylgalactosaminyltransferase 9 [Galendromus occidentalis]|uniref:Polypeptide N-acetylgalactosaminyltransferase n=1 Tax=Galendromus occidentalis TaxID=34638 RepID=A0AAJ6W0K0_9ACAR|nr:putative polypeptide N-acetylgalactosaminyltransferase 9 [Galendromus occidentalis]
MCFARRRSIFLKSLAFFAGSWVLGSLCFVALSPNTAVLSDVRSFEYFARKSQNYVPPGREKTRTAVPPILGEVRPDVSKMQDHTTTVPAYGEMGRPVLIKNINSTVEQKEREGWKQNAFNSYVSDLISVNRSLPDMRHIECRDQVYSSKLPSTSIIVCFHNEAWSVLIRTVHSILNRSPAHLIHDIILVDDFSDLQLLKDPLERYLSAFPKVRIVRAEKREGLIRARLLGASHSTAPVLTFLDSHVECTQGWLEPLLDRIAVNSTNVVSPVIDIIADDTLEYNAKESADVNVGGFDWSLQFSWHSIPERILKSGYKRWQPVETPTMAGGLFSIDRKFFERLGMYDPGFDIWGGENLELSFKTWMCGGRLEIIPCSHVGHIFRKRSPYKWRSGVNVLRRNSIRLAKVWMDEYANYYFERLGNDLGDYGDISDRIALRDKLKCHSFKWYIDEVYPELFVPGDAIGSGEMRNLGSGGMCLDSPAGKSSLHKAVGLYPCHGQGGNQYWLYSKNGEIRRDEACLDYAGTDVILYPCHGSKGNQYWIYDQQTKLLRHGSSRKCLEMSLSKTELLVRGCDEDNNRQKWKFGKYREDAPSV